MQLCHPTLLGFFWQGCCVVDSCTKHMTPPFHAFLNQLNVLDCALPVTWLVDHKIDVYWLAAPLFTGEVMPIRCTMLASKVCFSIILSIVSNSCYYMQLWFSKSQTLIYIILKITWVLVLLYPGGMVSMAWSARPWTRMEKNELPLVPDIEYTELRYNNRH